MHKELVLKWLSLWTIKLIRNLFLCLITDKVNRNLSLGYKVKIPAIFVNNKDGTALV